MNLKNVILLIIVVDGSKLFINLKKIKIAKNQIFLRLKCTFGSPIFKKMEF
jgi:hypothetical protein